jgi:hypothetical protein
MFGGHTAKDEVTRAEQLGWSIKSDNGDYGDVLPLEGATALRGGVYQWLKKQTGFLLTRPTSLDMLLRVRPRTT